VQCKTRSVWQIHCSLVSMSPTTESGPRRVGAVIYLKKEHLDEYKRIHAAVWPDVLAQIKDSNIADCEFFCTSLGHCEAMSEVSADLLDSIFLLEEPRPMLFASYKYVGDDWDADMKRMAANPKVKEWWTVTDSMQESQVPGATGSADGPGWWTMLEEVFYEP
jgi:L-rhamnose mutarotase